MGSLVILCLLNNWPGVLTVVELNMTSNLLLTDGVKPWGVCACAIPAKVTTRIEDEKCILFYYRRKREK